MLGDPVQSFSVGYGEDGGVDERPFARLAASHARTEHREATLAPQGFWQFLPEMVWYLDEPVADAAAVPLYYLAKFARQFVTVALSGEGADEILAGYSIYQKMLQLDWLHRLPGISRLSFPFGGRKLRRYLDWAAVPLERRYRGVSSIFSDSEIDRLLGRECAGAEVEDFGTDYFERTAGLHPVKRMLYFDTKVWLPDDLLVKADKMTMANSLELRVPFLDHELVEWAWRLPPDLQIRRGVGKYLLRQVAADLVPREIVNRPKQGFVMPLDHWFRSSLSREARRLLVEEPTSDALFNRQEVANLITRHEQGREDASDALFSLAVLACWHGVFIEGRGRDSMTRVG